MRYLRLLSPGCEWSHFKNLSNAETCGPLARTLGRQGQKSQEQEQHEAAARLLWNELGGQVDCLVGPSDSAHALGREAAGGGKRTLRDTGICRDHFAAVAAGGVEALALCSP